MTKKVTTKDYVVDLGIGANDHIQVKSGSFDCLDLWENGYTVNDATLVNQDLVITVSEGAGSITVLDYVTAYGTSYNSFKYIKQGDHFTASHGEVDVLGEDVAINNAHLIDEFYANGTTVTGTITNDEIDISGYTAKDGKTGLTINALAGNDTIKGSAYNDTVNATAGNNVIDLTAGGANKVTTGTGNDRVSIGSGNDALTLGTGANEIIVDASQAFGDNVINLTKDENLTVTVTDDLAGQLKSVERVGSDVKLTMYAQGWEYTEVNVHHAGDLYHEDGTAVAATYYYKLASSGEAGLNNVNAYTGSAEAGFVKTDAITNLYKASVNTLSESTIGTLGYINGDAGAITTVAAATSAYTLAETEVIVTTAAAYTKAGGVYTKQTEAVALYTDAEHTVAFEDKISELDPENDHLYDAEGNEIASEDWASYARYTLVETDKLGATRTAIGEAQLYSKDANDNYTAIATPSIRYAIANGAEAYTGTVTDLAGANLYTKSGNDFTLAQPPAARYTVTPTEFGGDDNDKVSVMKADNNKYYTLSGGVYTSIDKSTLATVNTREMGVDLENIGGTLTFKNLATTDVTGAAIGVDFENEADITDLRTTQVYVADNLSNAKTSFSGTYLSDSVAANMGTTSALSINAGDGANLINTTNATGRNTINAGKNDDTVTVGAGNDVMNLGAGNNVVTYDLSKSIGIDELTLTKNENLRINMQESMADQIQYAYEGNDLVISAKQLVGKTYKYEFTKTETTDLTKTVSYHRTVTAIGDERVCHYAKIVETGTETKTYNYELVGEGKYAWVLQSKVARVGDPGTNYRVYNNPDSVNAYDDLGEEFDPTTARANLGKKSYIKTVTTGSYHEDDWDDDAPQQSAVASGEASTVYERWTEYTGVAAAASKNTKETVPSTTVWANPDVDAANWTWRVVSKRYNGDAGYTPGEGELVGRIAAATLYSEIEVNVADPEDTINVVDPTADEAEVSDDYAKPNDTTHQELSPNYGDAGKLVLKNFLTQDLANSVHLFKGTTGLVDVDLKDFARVTTVGDAKTSFTGTYVKDEITATATNKSLYINAGDGDNTIDLSLSTGKNTVTAGSGDDDITGGANDDTITPGAGDNDLMYDLNDGAFGNDKVTLTKNSTVDINLTEVAGVDGDQVMFSKVGNDVKVTAFGYDTDTTYNKYFEIHADEVTTKITGYQEATVYGPAVTVAYKKTEIAENYTPGTGAHEGHYLTETTHYNYQLVGGQYAWVQDGDVEQDWESTVPVDGEVLYARTEDAGAHWTDYVWDNPTDMGTTYTKTVTTTSWDGDGYDTEVSVVVTHPTTSGTNDTRWYTIRKGDAPYETYSVETAATEDTAHYNNTGGASAYCYQTLDWDGTNWTLRAGDPEYHEETTADAYYKVAVINGVESDAVPSDQATAEADEHYSAGTAEVVKVANDDVIGTITLVNAANAGATLQYNGADIYLQDFVIESATGGTLTGTVGDDRFAVTGGYSATFNPLAGDDVIVTAATSNTFNHTAGTDDIYSTGKNDTIALSAGNEITVDSRLSFNSGTNTYSVDIDGVGGADFTYRNAGVEKLTVNNNGTQYTAGVVTGDTAEIDFSRESKNIIAVIDTDDDLSYIDSKGNDIVAGNDEDNTYYYANGGTDIYKGGAGDDVYNVEVSAWSNAKNRLVISDSDGALVASDDDTLNLSTISKDKLAFYFDVDNAGQKFSDVAGGSDDLAICDKSVVKGLGENHVLIKDYNGDGAIENVEANGVEIDMATTIGRITTAVQGWLNRHHFDSTIDVMENGNKYDQASLLACFNNAGNIAEV